MYMKRLFLFAFVAIFASTMYSQEKAKVYFTSDISSESLIKIYQALGREASGRVAVKISTGEQGGNYYLHPELIGEFIKKINGKLVECNTAYGGSRQETAKHRSEERRVGKECRS